jgi:hypothetical protein
VRRGLSNSLVIYKTKPVVPVVPTGKVEMWAMLFSMAGLVGGPDF